jgi:hypothetical protein
MRVAVTCLLLSALVAGCAESVLIKSYPPGSKAFLDGVSIGSTPASTTIPRGQVSQPHTWRVEFRNCDAEEGQLQMRVAPGRIVSYIFTLGIVAIFKQPYYFPPVDAVLNGGDCETAGARPVAPAAVAPGITIQQIVGDHNVTPAGTSATNTQKLAQELETLRSLYNRKLITKDVYEAESQKAVREYTSEPSGK